MVSGLGVVIERIGLFAALKYRAAKLLRLPCVSLPIRGHSVAVRPRTHDLRVALTSLGREFDRLRSLLDPDFDGIIVDASGYIGSAALRLSDLFPAATIVSIEPSAANFEILCRNVAHVERIEPIQRALAPVAGRTVRLGDPGTGEWGFTIVETTVDRTVPAFLHEVETISLGEILERHPGRPIGLLKLDIEGAEKALFDQASAELSRIPIVLAELHDRIVEGCEESFRRFSKGRTVKKFSGEKYASVLNESPRG